MNAIEENITPQGDDQWKGALLVGCLGILGYGSFVSKNDVSNFASILAEYVVYAAIFFGLFHVIFVRGRGVLINGIAFTAIYASLFVGALLASSHQKYEAIMAISSIQEEAARIRSGATDPSGRAVRTEPSVATTPYASGEAGEIERFMKDYMGRLVAQRDDYISELQAIGWNSILDAQRLKNDTTLSESKAMLNRAKIIVDGHHSKIDYLMQDARKRLSVLPVSDATRNVAMSAFDTSMNEERPAIDALMSLDKQLLLRYEYIVNLLSASNWSVEGGRILFRRQSDLTLFEFSVQQIREIAQKQQEMSDNSFAKTNQILETVKNEVR